MSDEIKSLVEDLAGTFEEFKKLHEDEVAETKKIGEATAETKQAIDKANNRMDEIEGAFQKALVDLDTGRKDDGWRDRPEGKAFDQFLRKGTVPDEFKAQLQVGDDTAGGFLAPADYLAEIIKGVIEMTPFRSLARVSNTRGTSLKVPKRTGMFAAAWTASAGTRSETTGQTYGMEEIPTHELYARADVENQLIEDSAFDIESELSADFVDQFAKAEGTAFVAGTGSGQPEGFTAAGASLTTVNTATANTFVANDLINLYYALKTEYAVNGAWLLNRGIIKAVRKFQDAQGNYLWQPGLAGLAPATILDRPYVEAPDLAASVASAAKIAAFGDWTRCYRIVDRINLQIQRDPYTQAYSGATVFHARRRVGGQVVNSEAAQILVVA